MSLRHTILALLEAEESTGYDLAKQFQGTFGHFWTASHQQIYQELAKLNEAACVSFEEVAQIGKPGKKVYRATDKGRHELAEWINTPIVETKIRDELLVRMVASHLVPLDVIREHLHSTKIKRQEKLLAYLCYEKLMAQPQNNNIQQALIYYSIQWGIRALQTWIAWAEEVLMFLENESVAELEHASLETLCVAAL